VGGGNAGKEGGRVLREALVGGQLSEKFTIVEGHVKLGGTVALENLTINTARKRQRAAAQLLRRWAEQPALPLRRLTLKLFNPQAPLKALTNACVAVKGRHSHLDIKLVPHKA